MTSVFKAQERSRQSLVSEIENFYGVSPLQRFVASLKQKHSCLKIGISLFGRITISAILLLLKIEKVKELDYFLGTSLQKLKKNFTMDQKDQSSPQSLQQSASQTSQPSMFVSGLDSLIAASENLLYRLDPSLKPQRQKTIVGKVRMKELVLPTDSPFTVARKTPLPSERSDDENDLPYEDTEKPKAIEETAISTQKSSASGFLQIVIIPVRYLIVCLRAFRRIFESSPTSSQSSETLSPEKQREIDARRKVSPRKRIPKEENISYIGHVAKRLAGIKQKAPLSPSKIANFLALSKGNEMHINDNIEEDGDNKRKHDEILTEDDYESDAVGDEADLKDLDLENYDSEEDPDYVPGDGESDDSGEFSEGDTESDIEFEVIDDIRQIKEKNGTHANENIKEKNGTEKNGTDANENIKDKNGQGDNVTDDMKQNVEKPVRKRSTGGKKDKNKARRSRKSQGSQSDEKKTDEKAKTDPPMTNGHDENGSGDHKDESKPQMSGESKPQMNGGSHETEGPARH